MYVRQQDVEKGDLNRFGDQILQRSALNQHSQDSLSHRAGLSQRSPLQLLSTSGTLKHHGSMMDKNSPLQRQQLNGSMGHSAGVVQASALNKDGTAQFKSMDSMGMDDVHYSVMSERSYKQWQKSDQGTLQMHGTARHGNNVIVTQFKKANPYLPVGPVGPVHRFLGNKWKGAFIIAEGVLSLAAGIILTGSPIPGTAAIGMPQILIGALKIVRGIMTMMDNDDRSSLYKGVMDAIRMAEAVIAIANAGKDPRKWVFGIAKALRSLITAITNYMGKEKTNSTWYGRGMKKMAAGLHAIEVAAAATLGISGVGAGETAKVIGGAATLGVAGSKAVRTADQIDGL